MYQALQSWNNNSFKVLSVSSQKANGDKTFAETTKSGYVVETEVNVINDKGIEVTSNTQIYCDVFTLEPDSMIKYPTDGEDYIIQKVGTFNSPDNTADSLMVIYL